MKSIVCGRFYDKYIIARRSGSDRAAVISKEVFDVLSRLSAEDANIPNQLVVFLRKLGVSIEPSQRINDVMHTMPLTELFFGSASYEITERCNYQCRHCVLGDKKATRELSVIEKRQLIETIRSAGCMYLRITGGEPLLASGFKDTYSLACSLGMLVKVQTNGSLLSERKKQRIFEDCPPYKIVISFYGGSRESYQSLTRTPGSFECFLGAVEWLKKSGILVKANIIITQYNEHEIDEMVDMTKEAGFEYFIYPKLTPTFQGDPAPIDLKAQSCSVMEEIDRYNQESILAGRKDKGYEGCLAGKAFFHVARDGKAAICQTVRKNYVNLLEEGVNGLLRLAKISKGILTRSGNCIICEYNETCSTCPPNLELFQEAGRIPYYICKKYGS